MAVRLLRLIIRFAAKIKNPVVMRRFTFTIIFFCAAIAMVSGQEYNTSAGVRLGLFSGLTVKHFVNKKAALEGLFATRWQGFEITGLYEIHEQAFDVDNLYWYYGFGAHLGFYNGRHVEWGTPGSAYSVIGIDGVGGLEYSSHEVPFTVGIDLKPSLNLFGYTGFWTDLALSVRYRF